MSIRLVNAAFSAPLPTTEKMVLLALCHCHNDETKKCNPMVKRLMEMTGLSNSSIAKALKSLQVNGYLSIHRGQGNRACYVISEPESWGVIDSRSELGLQPKKESKEMDENPVDTSLGNEGGSFPEVKEVHFRSEGGSFQKCTSFTSEVKEVHFSNIEKEKKGNRKGIEQETRASNPTVWQQHMSDGSKETYRKVWEVLRSTGVCRNPHDLNIPKLKTLINRGVTLDVLIGAIQKSVGKRNGLAYAIGIIEGLENDLNGLKANGNTRLPNQNNQKKSLFEVLAERKASRESNIVNAEIREVGNELIAC